MEASKAEVIKILGHDYTIERLSSSNLEGPGECIYFNNLIKIASDCPVSTQNEVLLHEIIEAICNRCEVHIEHQAITAISEGLHQVLRDNRLKFFEDAKKAKK